MIHPTSRPKTMPDNAKARESFLMRNLDSRSYRPRRRISRPGAAEHSQIVAHGALQADEQRVRDQRVADRHFRQIRERSEQRQVSEIEVVPRIDTQPERMGRGRRRCVARKTLLAFTPLEGTRVRLGVQLDAIGTETGSPADRL